MTLLTCAILTCSSAAPCQDPAQVTPPDDGGLVGSLAMPAPEEVIMLRLRNGQIHWGAIPEGEHDPDGFRFKLLSHGGLVDLSWQALDPAQELLLRTRYNYVDISTEELMVDVETLELVDGKELTGVILSRDGEHFVLKHEGSLQLVPKQRVQNTIRGGRLPALDVYSREELYSMHAADAADDDPEAQHELAKLCEQILDFEHAVAHYEAVLELDQDTDRQDVEFALARARLKAEQQAQIEVLRDIDHLRKRKRFDEALVLAEAFPEMFEDSPLISDAYKARDRILVAREDALRDLVRRSWGDHTRRIARTAAKSLGYEAAMSFGSEGYGEAVLAAVTEDVHDQVSEAVGEDDVLAYWATRKKVRFANATYGEGTWLLGEERALAGTEDKAGKPPEGVNERDAERDALEKKIADFLRNQSQVRRRRTSEEQAEEHEAYWAQLSVDDKAQWIRAYYVEFGGDFELRDHPTLHNCPSCGGKGVREIINAGAGTSAGQGQGGRGGGRGGRGGSGGNANRGNGLQLVACGTCRGVGRFRRVFYR